MGADEQTLPNVSGERVKILLVDDVELFLELEKTFLRRDEVDLLVARNGEDALDLMARECPDLVFLDLYMPGINGDEVCRQLKKNGSLANNPVIMVLQAGSPEDERRCREAGCNEILFKPVRREAFIAAAARNLPVTQRSYPRIDAVLTIRLSVCSRRKVWRTLPSTSVPGVSSLQPARFSPWAPS
jgi:CheY-like chemotaxis protein